MDLCRICLSTSTVKDIHELETSKREITKTYSEILSFCLDIQVKEDSNITTKLCRKCFRKILSFYEFKTLALKNDVVLKTTTINSSVKLEALVIEKEDNSNIDETESNNEFLNNAQEFKTESDSNIDKPEIKLENDSIAYESDDEILSVIKSIRVKEEESSLILKTLEESNFLNVPITKRGRPKKIKLAKEKLTKTICEECGKSVCDIKTHSKKHTPLKDRKLLPCDVCEKTFVTKRALKVHNQRKHLAIRYSCEVCGKEVSDIRAHKLRMHEPEKLKFQCVVCEKKFINQNVLDEHMLHHTKDKPYECDVCQKRFRLKVVLTHHKRQVHEKERTHLCQFCSKSFFKKYHLQIHLRSHTKEKPCKCEECGRCFSNTTSLKNHRETHNTEKNFHCEYCDMKFVRRDYLRVHMICHTKQRNYPCMYCGIRFFRSDHRKRHQYTAHEKHLSATA